MARPKTVTGEDSNVIGYEYATDQNGELFRFSPYLNKVELVAGDCCRTIGKRAFDVFDFPQMTEYEVRVVLDDRVRFVHQDALGACCSAGVAFDLRRMSEPWEPFYERMMDGSWQAKSPEYKIIDRPGRREEMLSRLVNLGVADISCVGTKLVDCRDWFIREGLMDEVLSQYESVSVERVVFSDFPRSVRRFITCFMEGSMRIAARAAGYSIVAGCFETRKEDELMLEAYRSLRKRVFVWEKTND